MIKDYYQLGYREGRVNGLNDIKLAHWLIENGYAVETDREALIKQG